jgi:glycosyltransferase involved in cell wall biosynthesis
MPRVSVIINCLNGEKYLRQAIDSVYAQTFADWEIVLCDNASTDSTPAIARSYDERVRYFRRESTVPLGQARNSAIDVSRGQYIAFLDCDDMWLPQRLARQVPLLDAQPRCDLIYSNFFHLDDRGRQSAALRGRQPSGHVFERFLARYPVGILTVLLRRTALDRLGELFDPALHLAEDYDLFMRVLYRSEAAYIDDPLAIYRIHSGMSTLRMGAQATAEFYHCLEKLRKLDAASEQRYTRAFARAALLAEYALAKRCLAGGEPATARRHIAPFKWASHKSMAVYLASFLPPVLWFALRPLWARGTFR